MKAFKAIIYPLLLCLLMLGSGAPESVSGENHTVLVINSDASVAKYRDAQAAFTRSIALPVSEAINLADQKWAIRDVEDLLYDTSADLIYCIGTKAYLVANRFAGDSNIIFSSTINWERLPLGQKTFGVSNELPSEMQMTLFKYIFPGIRKIGVLYSSQYNGQWFAGIRRQARELGLEIVGRDVSESRTAGASLREMLEGIDALWLISDPVVLSDKQVLKDLFDTCDGKKKPVFSYHDAFTEWGAALILSVDTPTVGRQAAGIAENVISGKEIEERVQFPAGSHIILNLKKIKGYGIKYNESALGSVNEIIE